MQHDFHHGLLELAPGEEPVPVNYIPDEIETLAEVTRAAGYGAYGIASNVLVGEEVGFERGFDRFIRLDDKDADLVNAQVAAWQGAILDESSFFLYLHYFDPHDPFHAREPWFHPTRSASESGWPEEIVLDQTGNDEDLDWILSGLEQRPGGFDGKEARDLSPADQAQLVAWLRAAYDSEIGFVDSRIREVFDMLGLEEAVVIFLADHGEEFFEHGDLTHGYNLHGETTRVPLFIYLPHEDAPRGRVRTDVSTIDIVPTVRRPLELPVSAQDQGQDLLADAPRTAVLGHLPGNAGQHSPNDDLRSIVLGDHRLIATTGGRLQLYDLSRDPLERVNLADELPNVAANLLDELERLERDAPRFERALRIPRDSNEGILEHLKGLGYLGR